MTGDGVAGALRYRAAIFLAGIVLSFGGLIIRQVEVANPWQIMLYRSGFLTLCLIAFLAWRERGRLPAHLLDAGWAGVVGGLGLGTAMTGFVWSITHTTVANTLFILSTSPFFAAILGRLFIGERVRLRTWLAMAAAGTGIALMIGDGIVLGDFAGQLAALIAAVGIAVLTVALRRRQDVDLMAAVLYGAAFSFALALVFNAGAGLAVPLADAAWCLLYGGPVAIVGLGLFIRAGRFVPAAEVALLSLSEVALGPLWVWLLLAETPTRPTLIGGAIVLAAVVGQILSGGRPRQPPAPLD